MTPNEKNAWDDWLSERRAIGPKESLSDQIMNRVEQMDLQRNGDWSLMLIQRLESNRMARIAVCAAALIVGAVPFLFLAYVSKFL